MRVLALGKKAACGNIYTMVIVLAMALAANAQKQASKAGFTTPVIKKALHILPFHWFMPKTEPGKFCREPIRLAILNSTVLIKAKLSYLFILCWLFACGNLLR